MVREVADGGRRPPAGGMQLSESGHAPTSSTPAGGTHDSRSVGPTVAGVSWNPWPHTLLLAGGLAVGLALVLASWWSYPSSSRGAVDLAIGWAFLLTGFLASWRRPANRVGSLLTAVGLTWYAGNLRFLGSPAAYAVGAWLAELPVAVLAQLVLTFPTGDLRSRADRVAVGVIYGAVLGLSGLRTLTLDPLIEPHCGLGAATSHICVRNAALLFHSRSLGTLTANLHDGVLGLVTIGTLGL